MAHRFTMRANGYEETTVSVQLHVPKALAEEVMRQLKLKSLSAAVDAIVDAAVNEASTVLMHRELVFEQAFDGERFLPDEPPSLGFRTMDEIGRLRDGDVDDLDHEGLVALLPEHLNNAEAHVFWSTK
jgi:Arc/MetJ family transcription regulator